MTKRPGKPRRRPIESGFPQELTTWASDALRELRELVQAGELQEAELEELVAGLENVRVMHANRTEDLNG